MTTRPRLLSKIALHSCGSCRLELCISVSLKGFISYLTKLCDQVLCLISQEHAEKLVWKTSTDQDMADDDEDAERMFSFEVSKTNEQEESVNWRAGFEVSAQLQHGLYDGTDS
jgi:hypothetical protein